MKPLYLGFIVSTNGSVFKEFFNFITSSKLNIHCRVVVDRDCGVIEFCKNHHIDYIKIENKNNKKFSKEASDYFETFNIDFIFLFFSRLITSELFNNFLVLNIHPSILPSYKGMNAIEDSLKDGALFQGCTLHIVNEDMDGGQKIVQTVLPIIDNKNLTQINKVSFLQKLLVLLILVDHIYESKEFINYDILANHGKTAVSINMIFKTVKFKNYFLLIEEQEGEKVYYE